MSVLVNLFSSEAVYCSAMPPPRVHMRQILAMAHLKPQDTFRVFLQTVISASVLFGEKCLLQRKGFSPPHPALSPVTNLLILWDLRSKVNGEVPIFLRFFPDARRLARLEGFLTPFSDNNDSCELSAAVMENSIRWNIWRRIVLV